MKTAVWYLGACPVCGGDMHDDVHDAGWATCLMCARSINVDVLRRAPHEAVPEPITATGRGPAAPEPALVRRAA